MGRPRIDDPPRGGSSAVMVVSDAVDDVVPRRHDRVGPLDDLVIVRMAAMVAFAGLAYLTETASKAAGIALVLLLTALCQPFLTKLSRDRSVVQLVMSVIDVMATAIIVAIEPTHFQIASILLVSLVAVHATGSPLRVYVPFAVFTMAMIGALGVASSAPFLERTFGLGVILAVFHGFVGHGIQQVMSRSRRDLALALGAAGGFAHVTDLERGVVEIVGDVHGVVGWSEAEWLASDHRNVLHPDDVEGFWLNPQTAQPGTIVDRTARVWHRDGRWIWLRDVSRVVVDGASVQLRGVSMDVTAATVGLDRVTSQASTDELTRLGNRRSLMETLRRLEPGGEHHLVLIDLNRFKEVNDTLGHDAGDQLLQIVAERLVGCLRGPDHLVRLGGDEFAIVFATIPETTVVMAALDRLALEVARPIEIHGMNVTTSISAGIVRAEPGRCDATTMLRQADLAMYAAKRAGRTWACFDRDLEQQLDRRMSLMSALPDALRAGQVQLHFQPIVGVVDGEIVGAEGLVRWAHPEFGWLLPGEFLDVVLKSELAGAFTRETVGQGIVMASRLAAAGTRIPVSVNIPVRVLEDEDFAEWFAEALVVQGVEAGQLVFEVAERDLHHEDTTVVAIDRFAGMGTGISIDDFGTGHASFERLRWRNVEQLKLDRSLVQGAMEHDRDRAILSAIVAMAIDLGYTLVAEGVERPEQVTMLADLGCHCVQGFLFSRAVDPAAFVDLVADNDFRTTVTAAH